MLSRFRKPLAEGVAILRIGARDLDAALRKPEPAHAMGEARGAKADLRELQPVALVHQEIGNRDFPAPRTRVRNARHALPAP